MSNTGVDKLKHSDISLVCGVGMIAFAVFTLLGCGISILRGGAITPAIIPTAFACTFIAIYLIWHNFKEAIIATLVCAATFALGCFAFSFLYDTAYDSIGYHLDTVVLLANGWNPISDPEIPFSPWSVHYAKGIELLQAATLTLTGNLEASLSFNFIILIGTLLICWYTIGVVLPKIKTWGKVTLIVLIACNTVLCVQILSALNDYMLWLETCLLTCGIGLTWNNRQSNRQDNRQDNRGNWVPYVIIFMAMVLAVNSKMTHFFYIGLECLFWAVWCAAFRRKDVLWKSTVTVLVAIVVGVGIIGYNPYITNTVDYGSVIYPLGEKSVDIMTINTPEMMLNGNRFTNCIKGFLSTTDAPWALVNGQATAKGIIDTYSMRGNTVNGFGVAMPILLVLALVLMILSRPKLRWWVAYLFVWALCFCFEQSWWARYVPFLWMNVVLPIALALQKSEERGHEHSHKKREFAIRVIVSVMVALGVAGAAIAIAGSVYSRMRQARAINYIMHQSIASDYTPRTTRLRQAARQWFDEKNVSVHEITDEEMASLSDTYYIIMPEELGYIIELPTDIYPEANRYLTK